MPCYIKDMTSSLTMSMTYLYCLGQKSLSAYKARRIFKQMCLAVLARFGFALIDQTPDGCPYPVGWTQAQERTFKGIFT